MKLITKNKIHFSMISILVSTMFSSVEVRAEDFDVFIVLGASSLGCEETFTGCFDPSDLTISVGDIVTWSNRDTFAWAIASGDFPDTDGEFNSGLLSGGASFTHTFLNPGEFDYFSLVHPWQQGIVRVVPIPEPTTFTLLAIGGLGLLRRRVA